MQELRSHAGCHAEAADGASQIAGQTFDLDDFRAVVRQSLRGERPDHDRREIDDAYAFERTAGHARYVKVGLSETGSQAASSASALSASASPSSTTHSLTFEPSLDGSPQTMNWRFTKSGRTLREAM